MSSYKNQTKSKENILVQNIKEKCLVCETACKMFPQILFWNHSEAAKKIDILPTKLEE